MSPAEFQKIHDTGDGRRVGKKEYYQYCGLLVDSVGSVVSKKVNALVNLFRVDSVIQSRAAAEAHGLAVRLLRAKAMTTDEAAVTAVAYVFRMGGRSYTEISAKISQVYPWVASLGDLALTVTSRRPDRVKVLVRGEERKFKLRSRGSQWVLTLPVYITDDDAEVRLMNATLVDTGEMGRGATTKDATTLILNLREKNYEIFKLLKRASLEAGIALTGGNQQTLLTRYSVSRLRLTCDLLREIGHYQGFIGAYTARLREKLADGGGKTPRTLAEEALHETESLFIQKFQPYEKAYARMWAKMNLPANESAGIGFDSLRIKSDLRAWDI